MRSGEWMELGWDWEMDGARVGSGEWKEPGWDQGDG